VFVNFDLKINQTSTIVYLSCCWYENGYARRNERESVHVIGRKSGLADRKNVRVREICARVYAEQDGGATHGRHDFFWTDAALVSGVYSQIARKSGKFEKGIADLVAQIQTGHDTPRSVW
jgi:hypothetical protein